LIEYISEVIYILIIIHSDKKAVKQFLEELKEIIENSNFDIVNNLLLIKKKKNTGKEEYSTPYTMTKRVLCLSFHYAEYKMTFPYA